MAKVRIQAGSVSSVEEQTEKQPQIRQNHHKHPGAFKILMAIWKSDGFSGWYQVCRFGIIVLAMSA